MNTMTIREAATTAEGEGAEVNRLMPVAKFRNFDPFVLWDHFTIEPGGGFPDHPHRGFEAISYLFQGALRHTDSLGNHSTVCAGGAQRFTAGRGIVHSEMPATEGRTQGIQLWVNLPQRLKSIESSYQQVNAEDIPEETIDQGKRRIIAGENGPSKLHTGVLYFDLILKGGVVYEKEIPAGFRGFVYLVQAEAVVNGETITTGQAAFMEEVDKLVLTTSRPCRAMVCFGHPHNEPIRQWGTFVD
jgi:redox-sensitive bicupin YhaK (pirin superfamily)